jgi:outer membrane lipoprotein carrier protein
MRTAAFTLLLLACLCANGSPASRVDQYLSGLTTWSADFEQRVEGAQGTPARKASGHLYLQKPGKFRWNYVEPNEQVVLADGKKLWFYDKDLAQANVRDLDSTLDGSPAMLLASGTAVSAEFEITELPASMGLEWYQLKPKHGAGDFLAARVGFLKGELVRMRLADKLNQLTELAFSHAVRNQPLPADLFFFTPPPGVDVIGQDTTVK